MLSRRFCTCFHDVVGEHLVASTAAPTGGVSAYHPASSAPRSENGASAPAYDAATIVWTSKEKLRVRLYLGLFFFDVFSIATAFAAANLIRFGEPLHAQGQIGRASCRERV